MVLLCLYLVGGWECILQVHSLLWGLSTLSFILPQFGWAIELGSPQRQCHLLFPLGLVGVLREETLVVSCMEGRPGSVEERALVLSIQGIHLTPLFPVQFLVLNCISLLLIQRPSVLPFKEINLQCSTIVAGRIRGSNYFWSRLSSKTYLSQSSSPLALPLS